MATDWIKFKGGKHWGAGDEDVWVRISAIEVVSVHPVNDDETVLNTTDVQVEVKGKMKEVMKVIMREENRT